MKLVFATHNVNKFKEIQALIPSGINLVSLNDIGCNTEVEETGKTLQENAHIKAQFIYKNYGLNCFADDTGLEVDALNGEPGIYSARYAGNNVSYEENVNKLLNGLKGEQNRKAQFRTVISLIINEKPHNFQGVINGNITTKKSGKNGFGYDPVFKPNGYDKTFAEMDLEEKNKISHRALAFKELINYLNKYVNI